MHRIPFSFSTPGVLPDALYRQIEQQLQSPGAQRGLQPVECAPLVSAGMLRGDISALATTWRLQPGSIGGSFLTRTIKKIVFRLVHWLYAPVLEQQSIFNLRMSRCLDALSQDFLHRQSAMCADDDFSRHVIFCTGSFAAESKLDVVLLAFRYLQVSLDPKAQLVVVGKTRGSETYHDYLQELAQELQIRNLRLIESADDTAFLDYLNLAGLAVSCAESDTWLLEPLALFDADIPFVTASESAAGRLGGRAVLTRDIPVEVLAGLWHSLLSDNELRDQMLQDRK